MDSQATQATWYVILNPASGGAKRAINRCKIDRVLTAKDIDYELHQTAKTGDAEELAEKAALSGVRRILVAGGDGTLHEVVNGLMAAGASLSADITIGLLPLGTGNDWARTLGVPLRLEAACELLKTGLPVACDLGEVACIKDGQVATAYFVNIAGVGIDAHIVRLVQDQSPGRMQYWIGLLKACRSFQAPQLQVCADGWQHCGRTLGAFVCIGRFLAGGMRIAPQANYHDGLFEITVIDNLRPLEILLHIPMLLFGNLASSGKVRTTQARSVTVEGDGLVQADGEIIGHLPATFRAIPKAIRVLVDRRRPPGQL